MRRLRLATRASTLALVQSKAAAAALTERHPGLDVELVLVKSEGDSLPNEPLTRAGGFGLFTKALEEALLSGRADLAVHSLKDLPNALAPGLTLAAVRTREDWRDAWLSPGFASPKELPEGGRVGTGSPRRRAQLALAQAGLRFVELRGNVDTRLRKLAQGEAEGAVLALAGLRRLGLESKARYVFSEEEMLPCPGQGFVALETALEGEAFALCRALNDAQAEAEASCERAFLARLESGCLAPVGALARTLEGRLSLKAFVGLTPGRPLRLESQGKDPLALGKALAERALGQAGA